MPIPIKGIGYEEHDGTSIMRIIMDASGIEGAPTPNGQATVCVVFLPDEEMNEETIAAKLMIARRTVQNNIAMVDPKHDIEPLGLSA